MREHLKPAWAEYSWSWLSGQRVGAAHNPVLLCLCVCLCACVHVQMAQLLGAMGGGGGMPQASPHARHV